LKKFYNIQQPEGINFISPAQTERFLRGAGLREMLGIEQTLFGETCRAEGNVRNRTDVILGDVENRAGVIWSREKI